jgi:flagellar biogenesis protein FliO
VSASQFLMIMAMLALVLGVMGITMRILRRYTMAKTSAKGSVKMEIIQRISLGQRQGLAVVRIGTHLLAVSMGDGGVHQVAELSDNDLVGGSADAKASVAPIHAFADGIRKLALVRGNAGSKSDPAQATRNGKNAPRISYVAPMEDFQAVLSMAMAGGVNS